MIPSDLAARLRMLSEASFFDSEPPVQGTARIREIQARLPQLLPGQNFTAHITRALPDNTFQATVAGRNYTLSLGQSAKPGDTLELVVTRQTANAVFARPAAEAAAQTSAQAGASKPNLSATGRLISFLLTGQPAPQATTLAGGQPLLASAPGNGSQLAPALRQALAQSGLFYESHQARWLVGRLGGDALLQQPQGRQPPLTSGQGSSPSPSGTAPAPRVVPSPLAAGTAPPEQAEARAERSPIESTGSSAPRLAAVAERLMPLVHQQLDAMATQQYVLHGQAWPGQHFQWDIDDPRGEGQGSEDESADNWNSTLRLSMPRLGAIEARLHLTPAGIAIRLITQDEATAARLDAGRERLDSALAAADVPLTGFSSEVRRGDG